jgi:hypothetical protein
MKASKLGAVFFGREKLIVAPEKAMMPSNHSPTASLRIGPANVNHFGSAILFPDQMYCGKINSKVIRQLHEYKYPNHK